MSEQPTFDTPPTETDPQAIAGRDANGVPPVVGDGDGKIAPDGKFVPTLSEEDNERLRAIVQQQQPSLELPDGSIRTTVTIPPEMVEILKSWAEGAGESFETYLQMQIETALTATVLGSQVG
jgi:hypothetical protein